MAAKKTVWDRNFAEVKAVRDRVREYFIPNLKEIRENRRELEEEWMRYFKMWNVTHDENHSYTGRAKLYIPEVRKNIEAQARQLTEAAFPAEDFFEVSPGRSGTEEGADIWKSLMRWYIEQAGLRVKYHVFARQECMLGTSPVYLPWTKKVEHVFRSAKGKDGKIRPTRDLIELFNGPDFVVVDLFKWYALNAKKSDFYDDGCAEYKVLSATDLLVRQKAGDLYGIKQVLSGNSNAFLMEEMERDVERAEAMGLRIENKAYSGEASLSNEDEERSSQYLVATIYTKMVFPEACLPDEDPELPIPTKIEIYNNEHVGLVRRNPFFHQLPPYVVGKYIIPNADEFYGQGIPKAVQYMQYEINSKAEQAMDSVTLALNPIAIVDPGLAGQTNEFPVEPGAIWWANPAGVKMSAIPDLSATGYQAIGQLRAQMQDYSDRSPALPPQLLGKSRTATQSEIVANTMSIDNKTFQIQNEILVLQPTLKMWEFLTDQNVTEDQVVMLLGVHATDWRRTLVPKNKLLGSYQYFWTVTNTSSNRQILARQVIDSIKVAGSIPPQAGLNFNFGEAFRMLWTEGFGLPNGEKILGLTGKMQSQDPDTENKMVELGMEVQVMPGDDDEIHMKSHDAFLKSQKDEAIKKQIMIHILQHRQQLERKVQAMQQMVMMQRQAQMMAMQQRQQGGDQQGKLVGSGNRTQLSPNGSSGDMASGVRA